MTTFDQILPYMTSILQEHADITKLSPILVNRDLLGRIRLIIDEKWETDPNAKPILDSVTSAMQERLGPHAYPPERSIIFEPDLESGLEHEISFPVDDLEGIYMIDRLATEGNWSSILPPTKTIPRIVFFSIKGGVGRSTAVAVTAWALAEAGKRVLVLDLDLESPGLSSAILPEDRRPKYGIADWLVEDLVDNSEAVFEDMVATSALSHNGEILVVPAHGLDAGEYIPKLGRAWMSKATPNTIRETWEQRLLRLLNQLEGRWSPDIILIDSRAGIDEVSSACLTGLSASTILLFAIDGDQAWSGYRILFRHWRTTGVARKIRDRLQVVGAMVPEIGQEDYLEGLRERSWVTFSEELYDELQPGTLATEEFWSFDEASDDAPHYPLPVRWHRSFSALKNLHQRLEGIDRDDVQLIFGHLLDGINLMIESPEVSHGRA